MGEFNKKVLKTINTGNNEKDEALQIDVQIINKSFAAKENNLFGNDEIFISPQKLSNESIHNEILMEQEQQQRDDVNIMNIPSRSRRNANFEHNDKSRDIEEKERIRIKMEEEREKKEEHKQNVIREIM